MDESKNTHPFDRDEERQRSNYRLAALAAGAPKISHCLALDHGTADDWLYSAMLSLKADADGEARKINAATVSVEALDIVIGKLEELLEGGEPWPWPEDAE